MAAVRSKRIGGGNSLQIFSLTSSGGNWTFNTELVAINQIIKTAMTGHERTKDLKLDIDHDLDSATFRAIFDTRLPAQGASDNTKYEDSSTGAVNAGDPTTLVGFIATGGVGTDGRRVMKVGVGQVTGGDESWEADKPVKIKFGITSVVADYPLVIGTAKFSTFLVSGALTTIAANVYGSTIYASTV